MYSAKLESCAPTWQNSLDPRLVYVCSFRRYPSGRPFLSPLQMSSSFFSLEGPREAESRSRYLSSLSLRWLVFVQVYSISEHSSEEHLHSGPDSLRMFHCSVGQSYTSMGRCVPRLHSFREALRYPNRRALYRYASSTTTE